MALCLFLLTWDVWLFAQSITAQGDCVVLKVERKQFTVLVGKANTLLERNREMYDMVNHELMEVRSHFAHCTCTRTARMPRGPSVGKH